MVILVACCVLIGCNGIPRVAVDRRFSSLSFPMVGALLLLESEWLRPILTTLLTFIILKVCRRVWPQPKVHSDTADSEEEHREQQQAAETESSKPVRCHQSSEQTSGCLAFLAAGNPCKSVGSKIGHHRKVVDRSDQKSDREKRAAARGQAELERFMLGY